MKSPSRKFIDLILAQSSKWANWNPPSKIKVGDYGTVDKETGQFEIEGNIYEDPEFTRLTANYPPETGSPEVRMIVSSDTVKSQDFVIGPEVSVAGLAEASIKGQWKFSTKRGALLVMAQPRSSYIPPKVLLKQLLDFPSLKEKSLVTEVVSCPAYSLYLSNANEHTVSLALVGNLPLPVAAPVSAGGEGKVSWWSQNTTGLFREACESSGEYNFSPLYTLKKIRVKGLLFRESPVPDPEDDDLWVDTQEPWNPLDEDGEEMIFEDTVFD